MSEIVFALDPLPERPTPLVYLAGPVPRDHAAEAWHSDAIEALRAVEYDGAIAVPRLSPGQSAEPEEQAGWEHQAMARADALLFWIPRTLWSLPGLTSNLEWGIWHDSGKAVLGAPPDAPKMRYLRFYADLAGAPSVDTLPEAARAAAQIALGGQSGR